MTTFEYHPLLSHQQLLDGEINSKEYVEGLKDYVDRRMGFGKYRGRAEGFHAQEQARPKLQNPPLLRRLGSFMIEGYNPYRNGESDQ